VTGIISELGFCIYHLLLWQLNTSARHSLERGHPGLDARSPIYAEDKFQGHDNEDFRKMDWGYCPV